MAEGQTILENPAQEPEIIDLANYLNVMGAKIRGAGTNLIKIDGVKKLHGCEFTIGPDYIEVLGREEELKPTNIKTAVYPGFPTDLQQPFTILLTQLPGKSKVTETIWENRFMHIPYLQKLGANIEVKDQTATITGPTKLKGDEVAATDLRAGAAMVAAGLLASGKTTITNAEHILRGYEQIIEKLKAVGAKISLKEVE